LNNKSLVDIAIAAVAAMLVASLVGTNSAFAGEYEKSQTASQANACSIFRIPMNVGC
jgi:hypothetical protein